jgi:hypothetical protein
MQQVLNKYKLSHCAISGTDIQELQWLLSAKGPLEIPILQIIANGGSARS